MASWVTICSYACDGTPSAEYRLKKDGDADFTILKEGEKDNANISERCDYLTGGYAYYPYFQNCLKEQEMFTFVSATSSEPFPLPEKTVIPKPKGDFDLEYYNYLQSKQSEPIVKINQVVDYQDGVGNLPQTTIKQEPPQTEEVAVVAPVKLTRDQLLAKINEIVALIEELKRQLAEMGK